MSDVRVSRKGADRFHNGHPWIFRSDVTDASKAGRGEVVRVLDNRGQFLGPAHYSSASQIAVRMLGRAGETLDFGTRIAAAQAFREQVVDDSTAYRLVHAEADFLPALIVDRYHDCFA
ncbi:MAG: class I SAM-dependent rRNA methyltransferase, partial [Acidobacteriota bacterium]